MIGELMYYFEQEVRAGRGVVRLDSENREVLDEIIIKVVEQPVKLGSEGKKATRQAFVATEENQVKSMNREAASAGIDGGELFAAQTADERSFLSRVAGRDKAEKFEEIKKIIIQRGKPAGLNKCRDTLVFPVGNLDASLAFVGEAPGADEEQQGQPFVGKAGELLTKMIVAMGLKREDVFICNVLLRRPSVGPVSGGIQTGNRPPTPAEMAAERGQLMTFLDLVRPKVVVCLGLSAVKGLLLMPEVTMSQVRGRWHEIREPVRVDVMPTYHPSYLLRNQSVSEKRKVWEDLMMVMERLGMDITERQKNFFKRS